jgi:hypothetical protein
MVSVKGEFPGGREFHQDLKEKATICLVVKPASPLAFLVRKAKGGKDTEEIFRSVTRRESRDEMSSHRSGGVGPAVGALSPLVFRFRSGREVQRVENDAGIVIPTENEWDSLLVTSTSSLGQRPELENGSSHPGWNAFPGCLLVDADLDKVRTPPGETAMWEETCENVKRELISLGNDEVESQRVRVTIVKGFQGENREHVVVQEG